MSEKQDAGRTRILFLAVVMIRGAEAKICKTIFIP